MVWVNHSHINEAVPQGMIGGSICMCHDCVKKRQPKKEKTAIEIMQEAQLPAENDSEG